MNYLQKRVCYCSHTSWYQVNIASKCKYCYLVVSGCLTTSATDIYKDYCITINSLLPVRILYFQLSLNFPFSKGKHQLATSIVVICLFYQHYFTFNSLNAVLLSGVGSYNSTPGIFLEDFKIMSIKGDGGDGRPPSTPLPIVHPLCIMSTRVLWTNTMKYILFI